MQESWRTGTNPSPQVAKPSPSPSPNPIPKYVSEEMMLPPTWTPSSPDLKSQSVSYFKTSSPTFTPVENPLPTSPVSPVKHNAPANDSTRAKSAPSPESLDCLTSSDDEEDGEEEEIASSVCRTSFEFVQQQPSSPLRQPSRSMDQDLLTDEEVIFVILLLRIPFLWVNLFQSDHRYVSIFFFFLRFIGSCVYL